MYDVIETGVLVVGGGGAGCRAAIEAHDQGADVLMILKGRLGNSGCTLNVGTSAAVGPWAQDGDSDDLSMRDLLAHGGFLGIQELAKVLVEESLERAFEMEAWGIDFVREDDGSIAINRSAAHTYPRNFTFKPATASQHDYGSPPGIAMMDVLVAQMQKRGIRVMEDVPVVDLLTAEGQVVGVTALDCRTNRMLVIRAMSTVLATGTYSQVFAPTTVSESETGDGQAAAFRAGADLIDMESTQFVATSVPFAPGTTFLNARGEPFLEKYGIPDARGVAKEQLVHAVWSEVLAGGGTPRDTVLLDMTAPLRDEGVASVLLPRIMEGLQETGRWHYGPEAEALDPMKDLIESFPRAHTAIGGVRINTRCESTLQGLYAAGAVAGGVYGHARPEGYTSMITLVFGRRAGLFAAERAKSASPAALDDTSVQASLDAAAGLVDGTGGVEPDEIKDQIRSVTRKHAWAIKNEEGMRRGLKEIRRIQEAPRTFKAADGYEWAGGIEVRNMLLSAELMLIGSIERKESRGAFFRSDYPETDDANWLRNIIYRQDGGRITLQTVPVELTYCGPETLPAARQT